MQRSYIFGIGGLMLGLVIGFVGANSLNRNAAVSQVVEASSQVPGAPAQSAGSTTAQPLPDVSEMLQKAESEPQNFAVQMRTGDMYARIGRFDKAIEFYSKGIVLKPQDFNANVVLANAYFDSGQFEQAADHYTKALAINPSDLNARTDLGATFVERPAPDYNKAIEEFKSVLSVDPKHALSLYYLGVAQSRSGDPDEAQKTLSRLESSDQNSILVQRLRQNLTSK